MPAAPSRDGSKKRCPGAFQLRGIGPGLLTTEWLTGKMSEDMDGVKRPVRNPNSALRDA